MTGAAQDGRIGPATIASVRAKPAGVVIDELCDTRLVFLKRLPTWATFGKGWASRVASVRRDALLMAAPTAQPAPPAPVKPVPVAPPPASPVPPVVAHEPAKWLARLFAVVLCIFRKKGN